MYSRWVSVYNTIPWPFALIDSLCLTLKTPSDVPDNSAAKEDKNTHVKLVIQTVSRYMHLCLAMTMRDICFQFRELMIKRRLTFVDMGQWFLLSVSRV